jgi:hypothetical protein
VTSAPSDDVERTARHAQQRIAESAIDAADAAATALQTQVDEELGQERARFVRSVRTTAFAGAPAVNRARVDLARYGDSVPAGGVIIDGFADPANWLPRDVAAKAEASG